MELTHTPESIKQKQNGQPLPPEFAYKTEKDCLHKLYIYYILKQDYKSYWELVTIVITIMTRTTSTNMQHHFASTSCQRPPSSFTVTIEFHSWHWQADSVHYTLTRWFNPEAIEELTCFEVDNSEKPLELTCQVIIAKDKEPFIRLLGV